MLVTIHVQHIILMEGAIILPARSSVPLSLAHSFSRHSSVQGHNIAMLKSIINAVRKGSTDHIDQVNSRIMSLCEHTQGNISKCTNLQLLEENTRPCLLSFRGRIHHPSHLPLVLLLATSPISSHALHLAKVFGVTWPERGSC